jgi:hypothetical protein
VKFEFERETNSNSISNFISNLSPKLYSLIGKMSSLCYGPNPSLPCSVAAQPKPPSRPTSPRHRSLFLSLSPTCGPRLAVSVSPHLSSLSFLLCLTPCAGQPSRPPKRAAGPAMPVRGTGCGRTARPARTPRAGARSRNWVRPRRKGEGRICPARGHPRRSGLRPWRATCPTRRRCQGHRGTFPLEPPRRHFKRRGEPEWPGGKANRPHLGFLLPP